MPAGRPTDYLIEYCDKVVELMKEGASKHEVCLELDIAYNTFLSWQDNHPEFLTAVKKGEEASRGWWEKLGRQGASGRADINPTVFIFNMKNRFRGDWNDKTQTELTGADGKDLIPSTIVFQPVAPRDPDVHG